MDVTEFRAQLMRQHQAHQQQAAKYTGLVMEPPKGAEDTDENEALRAAWLGHSMASNYAYALAAVLKMVGTAGGPEMAEYCAVQMAMVIGDGDYFDWNRDVR